MGDCGKFHFTILKQMQPSLLTCTMMDFIEYINLLYLGDKSISIFRAIYDNY